MFEQARVKLGEEVSNSIQVELKDNFSKAGAESLSKAQEYCLVCKDCTIEQAQAVYFIMTLQETAKEFFKYIDVDANKRMKKQFWRLLHPDKNRHPEAKQAFQKLQTFL